jgi:glycosyltransferase involved in cell wall biosynthesis
MSHIAIDARIISSTTGRYVERLIHYLEKIDRDNTYTILVRKKDLGFYTPQNPNFTITEADFADYSFAEQTKFLALLNSVDADLVHFCMPQQPILYRGNHVTTMHDLTLLKTYNSDKNWLVFHAKQLVGRFVFKIIARTSSYIFVPTKFTQKEYEAFSPAALNKTLLTYESADKVFSGTPKRYKHPFKKYILYVGQQSDYKNVRRLGDAHQQLLRKHPGLGLILVGKINASAAKNKAYFESKNYKNIHFTGVVSDAELAWLYGHTEAYVFPSLMEGFGLPGLEAMIYKAPVVSSNASCLPEVYEDAAHYFNPFNTQDIARSIDEVLTDSTLRQELIKAGNRQVKKYSWERMAKQTLAGYKRALLLKNN